VGKYKKYGNILPTEFAKAPFVIRAFYATFLRMSVEALIARRTVSIFRKPPTFWHASQIVFVKKFTSIAFLAQAT